MIKVQNINSLFITHCMYDGFNKFIMVFSVMQDHCFRDPNSKSSTLVQETQPTHTYVQEAKAHVSK
jgi:hypothetical protein